jgi:membrane-bound serine protease (ClpP class)
VRRLASRLLAAAICCALAGGVVAAAATPAGADARCADRDGCVLVLRISGLLDPVVVDFVERSVDSVSRASGYLAVVLELDSDGAAVSDRTLTELARHLRAADVPTSAWVGTGAEVRGAAAELVLALPHSAMAALSQIGDIGTQRIDSGPLAPRLDGPAGRLLTSTVSAGTAKDLGLVDQAVPTFQQYVATLDGVRTHTTHAKGRTRTELDSSVVFSKPDLWPQALHTMASPAVTYLLLAVGIGLLLFEFFTAGVGIAGIIGAAAALGAGYGLGVLPFRPWALVLLVAAMPAFGIDIQAGIQRFWTFVGLAFWIVGSVFLFDGVHLPYPALATGLAGMALAMVSGMPAMVRARFGTPTIGREAMVGELGEAVGAIDPDGVVKVRGASWRARTNRATPIAAGERARVVAIDGLTLEVEPEVGGARDHRDRRGAGTPEGARTS